MVLLSARSSGTSRSTVRVGGDDIAAAGGHYTPPIEILIVCTGNTCRSPMAEALLRQRAGEPRHRRHRGVGRAAARRAAGHRHRRRHHGDPGARHHRPPQPPHHPGAAGRRRPHPRHGPGARARGRGPAARALLPHVHAQGARAPGRRARARATRTESIDELAAGRAPGPHTGAAHGVVRPRRRRRPGRSAVRPSTKRPPTSWSTSSTGWSTYSGSRSRRPPRPDRRPPIDAPDTVPATPRRPGTEEPPHALAHRTRHRAVRPHRPGGRAPEHHPAADRLGELHVARRCWRPPARCSPTSTPRATRASATTAATCSSTRSRTSPASGSRRCSAPSTPTCSRTRGPTPTSAVYLALLEPGDKVMGMSLDHGGHLTHGSPVNISGRLYDFVAYGVTPSDERLDYDQIRDLARAERPKLIIAGATAYSRIIEPGAAARDRRRGRRAAHVRRRPHRRADRRRRAPQPGALRRRRHLHHAQDAARPAGRLHPQPAELGPAIDKAIFPGLQGGPLEHVIAAKAVAFREAAHPSFADLRGPDRRATPARWPRPWPARASAWCPAAPTTTSCSSTCAPSTPSSPARRPRPCSTGPASR